METQINTLDGSQLTAKEVLEKLRNGAKLIATKWSPNQSAQKANFNLIEAAGVLAPTTLNNWRLLSAVGNSVMMNAPLRVLEINRFSRWPVTGTALSYGWGLDQIDQIVPEIGEAIAAVQEKTNGQKQG